MVYAPPQPQQPAVPVSQVAAGAPYTKAPLGARLLAFIADGIIGSALLPLGLLLVYAGVAQKQASVIGFVLVGLGGLWQLGYTLGRDGFRGAGFGKRLTGLVVTRVESGAPASMGASIVRQLVWWALGIIPVIGTLAEPVLVISDKDGRRLGDKAAKTQVARATEVAARGHAVASGKTMAIIVLIVALLVSIAGAIIGGVAFARAINDVADGIETTIDYSLDPDNTDPGEVALDPSSPEAVVDAFYLAVASGDIEAVKATMSEELAYYAEPGMFEGWTTPEYRIVGSSDQGDGIYNVDVQEYDGDLPTYTYTYILINENGAWKIDDWVTAEDIGDAGAGEPQGATVGVEEAVDAVGSMLYAMQTGDVNEMKSYATSNFLSSDPGFFFSAEGALSKFEVVDAYPDAAAFVVLVSEDWNSGPESVMYFVIEQDGRALVDGLEYQ